jgi:hypothetical protein
MAKMAWILAAISIVLACCILVLAEGPRRWYSGIFFGVMGVVMLANALRWWRQSGG